MKRLTTVRYLLLTSLMTFSLASYADPVSEEGTDQTQSDLSILGEEGLFQAFTSSCACRYNGTACQVTCYNGYRPVCRHDNDYCSCICQF